MLSSSFGSDVELIFADILAGEESMLDHAADLFRKAYTCFEQVEHLKGMYVAKESLLSLFQKRN